SREVDRVTRGRRVGQMRGDSPLQFVRKCRQLEALRGSDVGRDDPVTAAVADDDDLPSTRLDPRQLGLREVNELPRRAHALHPGRAASRLDCARATDERTRVRPRRLGADLVRADGQQDDRLAGLDGLLRGARECTPVTEVLAVEGDHPRRLVGDEAADELACLEIRLVPERGEAREAEAVLLGEEGDLQREIPALGDQSDGAAIELAPTQVETAAGVEDAEAIRADEHRAGGPHALDDGGLAGAAVGSGLAQAGCYPHERLGARGERRFDSLLEPLGRDRQDDELWCLGQIGKGGIRRPLEDLAAVSIDEVDGAMLLAAKRSEGKPVPPFRRVVRGPENRDGTRVEERPEVPAQDSRRRREMMRRWMSEVPSSISSSLASRIHFSTGYSREYPMPPSVWTAAHVQNIAVSEAWSFAIAASFVPVRPASRRCAARHVRSR